MEGRGGSEGHESVQRKDEGASSEHRTSLEGYEEAGADNKGRESARVEVEEQMAEMETSEGSERMPDGSGSKGSGSRSESMDTESEFSEDWAGIKDREGSSSGQRRRRRCTVKPTLEVLWRSFEEEHLMDSLGSDFGVGVESGDKDRPTVSLVEESDLSGILANVNVGGEKGGNSAMEGSSCKRKRQRKKVVLGEGRRVRRKAAGDGVVLGENPLKEEKAGVSLSGVNAR